MDMLARIRAVLTRPNRNRQSGSEADSDFPQDEAVVVLGKGGEIQLAGGIAALLPNGRYTYSVRSLVQGEARQVRRVVEKDSKSITLAVPAGGIYEVLISDFQQMPRIDLRVAAVSLTQSNDIQRSFERAHKLFMEWNDYYQGWPVHEFQRAFLTSLMLGINPERAPQSNAKSAPRLGVSREPQFSPAPGVFKKDVKVRLHADTSGAIIHFTLDGSQPSLTSPVYQSPIYVNGTGLTIKAFATMPQEHDSPVVTGIFRIAEGSAETATESIQP